MLGMFRKNTDRVRTLAATQNGRTINMDSLPDPVFAEKMLGDGFAILPFDEKVAAPADGEIIDVQDSLHAYGLRTDDGVEILVHIGINTVALGGEGFLSHVKVGDRVKAGDIIAEANLSLIKEKGYEIYTITIITNMDAVKNLRTEDADTVRGKTPVMRYEVVKNKR